jgi:predicted transcriptional regulator
MLQELEYNPFRLLASKSVGVKTKLDGSKLRSLRKANDMKMEELARRSKLSKTTLYKHERSNDYAAIGTIYRLETVLNGSIKSEDVLKSRRISIRFNELAGTGMQALHLDKAPFDIVAKKKNYYEISLDANIRTLVKRAALFKEIKEAFENNYPFFINERGGKIEGVPAIKKKELMRAGSEEDLLNLVG